MTPTILITIDPLKLATRRDLGNNCGSPLQCDSPCNAPDGYAYVPNLPRPEPEDGYRWQRKLTATEYGWEKVAITPPSPLPVTKLTIKRRLDTLNKWETFKGMLAQSPSLQDEWDIAQDIRADDPMFLANEQAIKSALGVTDEEYSWILSD